MRGWIFWISVVATSTHLRNPSEPTVTIANVEDTHYILGSVAGPHPYPMMVRDFHACIGEETRVQCQEKWGGLPDVLVACIGGGSNAMGLFHDFVGEAGVRLIG